MEAPVTNPVLRIIMNRMLYTLESYTKTLEKWARLLERLGVSDAAEALHDAIKSMRRASDAITARL